MKLIVDPGTEQGLVDLLSQTIVGSWKDEKFLGFADAVFLWVLRRSNHPGVEPHSTKVLCHMFDSKKCSEAASQPKFRPPPMKDNRLKNLLSAVVCPG